MIFTEEELRQAWRNGSGVLPEFPPGTRFTPAALDFLSALGRRPGQSGSQSGKQPGKQPSSSILATGDGITTLDGMAPGGELVLQPLPDGQRLIITTCDLDGILAARPATVVVNTGVTVTDAAREILGKAGIRVTAAPANPAANPATKPAVAPAATPIAAPAAAASPGAGADSAGGLSVDKQELLAAARAGVLQRLGNRADTAVVDAVLQKIVSAL